MRSRSWWVIGLSVAFGLLPRHRWSVEIRLAVAGLLGLAAWTALGLLWTDSPERTLEEALRVLSYTGLVMLVAWAFGARDRTRMVVLLTGVAGVVCLLALLSRVAPELLGTQSTSGTYDTTRLAYPFNYWNAVGCWGAMTLALALPLSAHARPRWLRATALCHRVAGARRGLPDLLANGGAGRCARDGAGGRAVSAALVRGRQRAHRRGGRDSGRSRDPGRPGDRAREVERRVAEASCSRSRSCAS